MEDTVLASKPLAPWFCHALSLAAHVLLLGGAALAGSSHSPEDLEAEFAPARRLLVAAVPGEVATQERGGERKVSHPGEEDTMGPARDDARQPAPPGERAEAIKTEPYYADELPAAMYDPYPIMGVRPSAWFNGLGVGTGGKRDAQVDRGNRLDPAPPAQRRERGEADATNLAGGAPKTRVCPPGRVGEHAVYCRRSFMNAR
ncbi:hypothetical protein [Polyangium spumosum]|uniref:Uncharacterized protein n=1 Tax=Polyangium spumosum TaxID=889282 RepID=A0A6N7Q327_9BACT|nr:hypothetical protein [Polyangium spumosum]MRG98439.1 hypothetical protein [Polyangium spumosum]